MMFPSSACSQLRDRSIIVRMTDPAAEVEPSFDTATKAEEELRRRVLTEAGLVESLDDEDGLVFPLPKGSHIIRVLSGYDTRDTTNAKVRCSACAHHQLHNRGFRVEIEGGEHTRIGIRCGEKHFGRGAWQAAVSDYDRRVERAQYLARVKPALDAIERITPLVREWHERTNHFAKWMHSLRNRLDELFDQLADAAKRSEGRLERERRRKRKRVNRQGREETYIDTDVIVVARIPYPGMFLGESPTHPLNGATKEIGFAVALLAEKTDTASLAKAFVHLRRARQYLNDAARIHRGVLSNLTPGWLPALCDWANQDDGLESTYAALGLAIECDGETFPLLSPGVIGTPPIDRINELWP